MPFVKTANGRIETRQSSRAPCSGRAATVGSLVPSAETTPLTRSVRSSSDALPQRRWEKQDLDNKYGTGQFLKCEFSVEPACGRCKRAPRRTRGGQRRRVGSWSSLTTTRSTDRSWTSTRSASPSSASTTGRSEEVIKHHSNKVFLENAVEVSRAEFVALDKRSKTHLPELEGNQSLSNFELFKDRLTDGSFVSLDSCFLDRILFTIGTFPRHTPLSCAQRRPADDVFRLLASSRIFSDISLIFVTPLPSRTSS